MGSMLGSRATLDRQHTGIRTNGLQLRIRLGGGDRTP